MTAIPCGPGVAHCACIAELRAENEKLRALLRELAPWRTDEFLNPEAK